MTYSETDHHQTGSGKTYTMWGPANALLDDNVSTDQQGLTPRVFERLFARINEVRSSCLHSVLHPQISYYNFAAIYSGTFFCRSKSRMLIDNSSISVTVLFSR